MAASFRSPCFSSYNRKLRTLLTVNQFRYVNSSSEAKTTHFGFEEVSPEEKAERVQSVFTSVASRYDHMNDLMSAGIHRLWKDKFVAALHPTPGTKLIDVAGGTGDIAFRVLKFIETYPNFNNFRDKKNVDNSRKLSYVTVCDFNLDMIKIGQKRAKELNLNNIAWLHGDAQRLPIQDNSFDAYTISFGIRNVTHIDKALEEAYRVLRPGGRFMCLEFSQVQNRDLANIYDWYSFQILPVFGQVLAGDWKSYQYLVESIRRFPNQDEFKMMIEKTGFKNVSYDNLLCGVACIHSGFKL